MPLLQTSVGDGRPRVRGGRARNFRELGHRDGRGLVEHEHGLPFLEHRASAALAHGIAPATLRKRMAELVLQEADQLFDVEGGLVYLAYKDNLLVANAGIDLSNAPEGCAILWPERPWEWARAFRQGLKAHFGLIDLGVVVTDSHLMPLRRGVTGLAVAYAGFEGVQSEIGKLDLFGRPMELTEKAVADDLASASVLVTGEAGERTPFAVIRKAPVTFTDRVIDPHEGFIDPRVDLYAGIYNRRFRYVLSDGVEPGE